MQTAPGERLLEEYKRRAAERAGDWISDGMKLGLGTGSTVRYLLEHIAARREAGEWGRLVCVPTSEDTAVHARALGIPLASLADHPQLDLTIDGADEVDPDLRLIKGLGGALLREKIVAAASHRLLIIIDEGKLVDTLGRRVPLPVEVDPFGAAVQQRFLQRLGAGPALRHGPDGTVLVTDGGNHIFDCRFPKGILDPDRLDEQLNSRPGILEHGLFLDMADAVIAAGAAGTRILC